MVSINTNYLTTYSMSTVSGTSGYTESNDELLFNGSITEADSFTAANSGNELESQLNAYQSQKQQMEAQLQQYNNEKSQLEAKYAALETKANQIKDEIKQVESDRDAYEAQAKELKEKYEKDNITLLDLIKKMNEKVDETNQTIAQAAQEQNKKLEEATTEAFKKYESGEIKEDEISSYIAQKTGNQSLVDQLSVAGLNAVNSFSSQVKNLIAQMAQTLNYLNQNKVNIETATEKIDNSKKQLKVVRGEQSVVRDDIDAVDSEIKSVSSQIKSIDKNMASAEKQINKDSTVNEKEINNNQNEDYTASNNEYAIANPFSVGQSDLGLDLDSFVSVTTTIDFRGFKATLDSMMMQNTQSVQDLRDQIQKHREQERQELEVA